MVEKDLVFISPVDDFLRGLCFESSSDANCCYLWEFFLPLFVPRDAIGFTHGKRLRNNGNQGWYADNPNLLDDLNKAIHNQVMPFINSISTLDGVRNYLQVGVDCDRPRVNSHILEALAYTLIKCGDYPAALKALAEQKQRLEKSIIPWVVEQRNRAQLIEQKLLQNAEAALQQLEIWKAETIHNLKLEKFC